MKIVIPEIPPSYNRYLGNSNSHFKYHQEKEKWVWIIKKYLPKKIKTFQCPVMIKIKYYFKDNRRRDLDNYSGKFINDALVKCKVLKDDSIKQIPILHLEGELGSKENKVIIEIIPLKEVEK